MSGERNLALCGWRRRRESSSACSRADRAQARRSTGVCSRFAGGGCESQAWLSLDAGGGCESQAWLSRSAGGGCESQGWLSWFAGGGCESQAWLSLDAGGGCESQGWNSRFASRGARARLGSSRQLGVHRSSPARSRCLPLRFRGGKLSFGWKVQERIRSADFVIGSCPQLDEELVIRYERRRIPNCRRQNQGIVFYVVLPETIVH